jgi:hypothetical protein
VVFVILWLAASATSEAKCSDLCHACSMWYDVAPTFKVWSGNVNCLCPLSSGESKRGLERLLTSRAFEPVPESDADSSAEKGAKEVAEKTGEIIAKQTLNSAIV